MSTKQSNPDISKLLKEVEVIVDWFENEEIDLDKAVIKYEQGMKKIQDLEKLMQGIEAQIEKIDKDFSK